MTRTTLTVLGTAVCLAVATTAATATGAAAATTVPVVSVTASSHDSAAGHVPGNAVDANTSTRWSGQGDGVSITYDLGSARDVGSVSAAWYRGDVRTTTFDILTSLDGTRWTTVLSRATTSGATTGFENHGFADTSARFVRVVGHGNTDNDWTSISETVVYGPDGDSGGGDCAVPADVLNLRNWYIGLPTGGNERPDNVYQPELDSFSVSPWFVALDDCSGVRFRAAVNGVTTSGSSYPRSELREMNGSNKASWSSGSGTHTMTIRQTVTALPQDKPHLVVGQIHDSSDDVAVFRLEGTRLYLTNGDDSNYKLITSSYRLGTAFEVRFVVSNRTIKAYYNGTLQATISRSFSGGYFKAGAYTQANCGNSSPCSSSNYGEAIIHALTVTHS